MRVRPAVVDRFPFWLAPLAEQRRIVAAIDEHLSRLDVAVSGVRRVQSLVPRYYMSILTSALRGNKRVDIRAWEYQPLAQIASIASGNTPKGIDAIAQPSGEIPWFRISDMNTEGNARELRTARCYLSARDVQRLHLRLFPTGSIVFPKRGGAISTNKKRVLAQPSTLDLNTMGITAPSELQPWIRLWFDSIELRSLSDGSNVPQINHGDIRPLVVPLPPPEERDELVAELEQRALLCGIINAEVDMTLSRAERLRQSILKRAFEGKLVEQNSRDESPIVSFNEVRGSHARSAKLKQSRR